MIRRIASRLFQGRWRRLAWVIVVLAVIAGVIWIGKDKPKKVAPPVDVPFPIERLGPEWSATNELRFYRPTGFASGYAMFYFMSVSTSGTLVAVTVGGAYPPVWFFDVEKRRFTARYNNLKGDEGSWWPIRGNAWTRRRLLMTRNRPRRTRYDDILKKIRNDPFHRRKDAFFYEIDLETRTMRYLWGFQAAFLDTSFHQHAVFNRRRTALVSRQTGRLKQYHTEKFILSHLRTNREYTIPVSRFKPSGTLAAFVWDWLPDDCTVVIQGVGPNFRTENLYYLDIASRDRPRRIPVLERFEKLAEQASKSQGLGQLFGVWPLKILDEGQRVRLAATFVSSAASTDPSTDRSGIWDLDVETGKLAKVIDLKWGIGRTDNIECSPSGNAFVAIPTSGSVVAGNLSTSPTRPVLYRIGQPPVRLPFRIVFGWGSNACQLHCFLRFLDEDTLIYSGVPYDLWKYDVRTNQSELLFRHPVYSSASPPPPATTPGKTTRFDAPTGIEVPARMQMPESPFAAPPAIRDSRGGEGQNGRR